MATLSTPGSTLDIEVQMLKATPIPIVHPPYSMAGLSWAGDLPSVPKQAAENFNWG